MGERLQVAVSSVARSRAPPFQSWRIQSSMSTVPTAFIVQTTPPRVSGKPLRASQSAVSKSESSFSRATAPKLLPTNARSGKPVTRRPSSPPCRSIS